MVAKLIDGLLTGKRVDVKSQQSTIALGNKNEVQKDESSEAEKNQEEVIKKTAEAGKKKDQEERAKITAEGRRKKDALSRSKIHTEEAAKQFDEDLRTAAEHSKKKSREELEKATEMSEKKVEEATSKRNAQLAAIKRAETLLDAQTRAGASQLQAVAEMEKKKAAEAITKSNDEAAMKLSEQNQKFEAEVAVKKVQETQHKKEREQQEKKRQEEEQKERKRKQEDDQKAAAKAAEQAKKDQAKRDEQNLKERQRNAVGQWCQCMSQRVNWDQNNAWQSCQDGYLVAGLYRSNVNFLSGIQYQYCCKPCRPDGTVLKVDQNKCQKADWAQSMRYAGWKTCDGQTYIQAFYKSTCNWIYCLTGARCCQIDGSRARRSCGAKGSFASSFNSAGWSMLDKDQFLIGLYRSWGVYLSDIDFPYQCTFWAY
jgi:hypothetical protein